jgi:hypothetical protein
MIYQIYTKPTFTSDPRFTRSQVTYCKLRLYTLSFLVVCTIPYIILTMSQPSAYTVGPSSLPPSSQPDLSYVADIFDSTLDLNIDPSLFNS